MALIEVVNLKKRYKKNFVLKGVNLTIDGGEVVAVLGPNASGKTTLLKSILGLVVPTEGEIRVKGVKVTESFEYRKFVGYMPQEPKFPENVRVKDLIDLICDLREERPEENLKRLINSFSLEPHMDKLLKNLSGGTKQKVNAVLAFAFEPDILILDEPTAGLDPLSTTRLKDEILRSKEKGKAVILTSHVMSDVEEVADRIVFLIEGTVKVDGSVEEIKERTGEKTVERALAKILEESLV